MLKIRCTNVRQTRHSNSQSTESEKAEFHTPAIPNATRNCVEHNSEENISQDLVHPNKSDTEASASFDFKSEEREEIAEIADVPAPTPAPALERIEEQSTHTPGSRKSTRKNFGKPANSFSDFYMSMIIKTLEPLDRWITSLKSLTLHFTFCIQEPNKLYSIITVIGIDYC